VRSSISCSSSSAFRVESTVVEGCCDHELVRLGLWILQHVLDDVTADRAAVDLQLAVEHRDDHTAGLHRHEPGLPQKHVGRFLGEEPEVGVVEQPPWPVVEPALQQRQTGIDVRDVRERDDE
jgi:hypothetical protein